MHPQFEFKSTRFALGAGWQHTGNLFSARLSIGCLMFVTRLSQGKQWLLIEVELPVAVFHLQRANELTPEFIYSRNISEMSINYFCTSSTPPWSSPVGLINIDERRSPPSNSIHFQFNVDDIRRRMRANELHWIKCWTQSNSVFSLMHDADGRILDVDCTNSK